MDILEKQIVKKYIKKGDILYYTRFVDDTLICTKKGVKENIFKEMNNFFKDITFTECQMEQNELTF